MNDIPPHKLYQIIAELDRVGISFTLSETQEGAVTILAALPGHFWEIDVWQDGKVCLEIFRSDGKMLYDKELFDLILRHEKMNDEE